MKLLVPEIEKDVLGLEKPTHQLKPLKMKSDGGFLIISLILLMIVAIVVFYFGS